MVDLYENQLEFPKSEVNVFEDKTKKELISILSDITTKARDIESQTC